MQMCANLFVCLNRGVNPGGLGLRPPDFEQGVVDGSWNIIISYHVQEVGPTCMFENGDFWREIIIICPEVAVNGQFLPGDSNSFVKLPEKSKVFGNLPEQIEMLLTRIHDPQISNPIDAAVLEYPYLCLFLCVCVYAYLCVSVSFASVSVRPSVCLSFCLFVCILWPHCFMVHTCKRTFLSSSLCHNRIRRSMNHWTNEPLTKWTVEPIKNWTIETMNQRTTD